MISIVTFFVLPVFSYYMVRNINIFSREEENKKTKVTADDFKDRWGSESKGQKVVNI